MKDNQITGKTNLRNSYRIGTDDYILEDTGKHIPIEIWSEIKKDSIAYQWYVDDFEPIDAEIRNSGGRTYLVTVKE